MNVNEVCNFTVQSFDEFYCIIIPEIYWLFRDQLSKLNFFFLWEMTISNCKYSMQLAILFCNRSAKIRILLHAHFDEIFPIILQLLKEICYFYVMRQTKFTILFNENCYYIIQDLLTKLEINPCNCLMEMSLLIFLVEFHDQFLQLFDGNYFLWLINEIYARLNYCFCKDVYKK